MKQQTKAQPDKSPPLVVAPAVALTMAAFTKPELETLRKICRDSDENTTGLEVLNRALARAAK